VTGGFGSKAAATASVAHYFDAGGTRGDCMAKSAGYAAQGMWGGVAKTPA